MMTVIFATRNRAPILKEVLCAFCKLQAPDSGWKLVVVDNGSTDETSSVLSSFADKLPLTTAFERRLGKNYALNLGLQLVEGDLVVFTDDDVFPHCDWLIELRKSADLHLDYEIFGGAITPHWLASPPAWVPWVDQAIAYALTPSSLRDGPINPALVFGPNMMLRGDLLFPNKMRFDPMIGPRGEKYPMGSETELLLRLERRGYKAWHVSTAEVEHLIRPEQLTTKWIFGRGFRHGRGFYRMFCDEIMRSKRRLWFGVPRHMVRDLPAQFLVLTVALILRKPEASFRARWRLNFLYGQLFEALTIARERGAQPGKEHSLDGFAARNW